MSDSRTPAPAPEPAAAAAAAEPAAPGPAPAEPRSGLAGLWDRFGHLVRELGKFGVVGGLSFIVDTLLLNLLLDSLGPIFAKVVSTVVAATLAFIGNRFWTWRHRSTSSMRREYLLYFVFNAVGLGIAVGCLWLSHYGLGALWPAVFHTRLADNVASQIVGTGFGTIFRFWSYRTFVFAAPSGGKDPADAESAMINVATTGATAEAIIDGTTPR